MRKRPLAFICLVVAAALFMAGMASGSIRDGAVLEVQEYLADVAGSAGSLTFEGTVTEVNAVSEGVRLSTDQIVLYTKDKSVGSLSSGLKFIFTTEDDRFLPGDRVRVTGKYRMFEEAGNPGQFDTQEYYFMRNTVGRITGAEVSMISVGSVSLKRGLAGIRRALRNSYVRILDDQTARTVSAISLGEKSLMEQEWKQLYQEGGIAHIISISGLHISMIGMCIYSLLRRMRLPFPAAALPSAVLVALYALMSGFGISAMRACFMYVIWLGSQIAGRKYDMLTAAAVAAVLILLGDGRAASQSSFLLSFGAILSIAVLVPRITAANPFRRDKNQKRNGKTAGLPVKASGDGLAARCRTALCRFWDVLCGGAGVWLGTLPVTLWFFYQTAPWSVLVNLIVIPLMSALMASGLISCLVGLISVPAGIFLAAPVYYLLGLFEKLCTLEQQLPCTIWIAGHPALWKAVVYYLLLTAAALLHYAFGKRRETALFWIGAIFLGIGLLAYRPRSMLTVTCMDVGQGDGALIRFPDGTNCLIDSGSTSVSGLWEYRVSQTVKYYGISTLDYVFLSHADSDHINGIEEYLENYLPGFAGTNAHGITLKNLVLPPVSDDSDFAGLTANARQLGITVLRMEKGAVLKSGRTSTLTCLAPSSDSLSGDKNEDSMVLLLQYKSFRMLFTGDLEGDSETALAASGADLSCDVLKVGHHGSSGASSESFLAAASPVFGIISCGKDNSYGHPAAAAVERLRAAGIILYTTMDCGAVSVRSNGSKFAVSGYVKTEAY